MVALKHQQIKQMTKHIEPIVKSEIPCQTALNEMPSGIGNVVGLMELGEAPRPIGNGTCLQQRTKGSPDVTPVQAGSMM